MARLLCIVALLCIEFCVLATASEKGSYAKNTRLFAEIVETSTGPPETTTSALGFASIVFCYTAHCCGQVAQYCLMCPSLLAYIHGQYSCSERPAQSLMCQLNHLLFNMLLARLSVCPCQVQVWSQGSAELLQVQMRIQRCYIDLKTKPTWMAEHFLSRKFMHVFDYFSCPYIGKPCAESAQFAKPTILVWLCQSSSAIWSYSTLCFSLEIGHRWRVTCRYKPNVLLVLIDVFVCFSSSDPEEDEE